MTGIVRSGVSKRRSSVRRDPETCRGSRSRVATFTSSVRGMRGRSSVCSTTTNAICCRWPHCQRGWCSSWRAGRPRPGMHAKRSPWAASTCAAGSAARAREAFERAAGMATGLSSVRVLALRALALLERRERRFEAASEWWRRVLDVPRCPPQTAREAAEALAIHAEHRARDLAAARTFALKSLDADAHRGWNDAVRHRLARIDRKLSGEVRRALPLSTEAPAGRRSLLAQAEAGLDPPA